MTAAVRPLDRAESFFWFLDRLSSMNFTVIAEGRGPLQTEALQAALDRCQRRHSLLFVAIEGDEQHRLHFVPRPAMGIPLKCLSDEDWRQRLAEFNVQPFALGEAPLMRAYYFDRHNGGWVVALVFHHSIADGRSGFHLLSEVLQDAASPAWEWTAKAPRPAVMSLYPPQYSGEAAQQLGEQLKASRRELFERIGPPEPHAGHLPGDDAPDPRLVQLHLDAGQSATLLRRARQEEATITGIVGAAQLIALRRLFNDAGRHTLGLTCAADLRPYLHPPMDAETLGFCATLITCLQQVDASEPLWDLARHITSSVRQQMRDGAGHIFYHAVPPTERIPATAEGIESFRAIMAGRPPTSLISNAGQLPPLPDLPDLTVDALSFALCPTQVQPVFTAVTGHANGLSININHNRRQLPDEVADTVAAWMGELLRDAMLAKAEAH